MSFVWTMLKALGIGLLLAVLVVLAAPWGPVAWDSLTASRYASYLEENARAVAPDDPESLSFPDEFYDNQVFLFGEMHGYAMPQTLDIAFLTHLNETTGLRWYLAEVDPLTAIGFNRYLETGDEAPVRAIFQRWYDMGAQWGNREYFEKLQALRDLNQSLPEDRQIRLIGVDKPQDRNSAQAGLDSLGGVSGGVSGAASGADLADSGSHTAVNMHLLTAALGRKADAGRYTHILGNLALLRAMPGGDEAKLYGLWGIFHTLKTTVNGDQQPLAMRLDGPGGLYEGKVASLISYCASGCQNMMPNRAIPQFLVEDPDGTYTNVPINYDTPYLYYTSGIGEVKRAAGDSPALIVPLSRDGSPYRDGRRLLSTSGYLSMMIAFDISGSTGEAMDYLVLMQGSPALTPWASR